MMQSWSNLHPAERGRARTATAFLSGRLAERAMLEWALRLEPGQVGERMAVLDQLNGIAVEPLTEPYLTAWRLIEESWSAPDAEIHPFQVVRDIVSRVKAGERSGSLIDAISDVVRPRLEVRPLERRPWQAVGKTGPPRHFGDLLSARLTSISLFKDLGGWTIDIELDCISDVHFLNALASELMSVVERGHYIARRIYGNNEKNWGDAGRVPHVRMEQAENKTNKRSGSGRKPVMAGAFSRGLAPSVKLFHATITRLGEVDPARGSGFRSALAGFELIDLSATVGGGGAKR